MNPLDIQSMIDASLEKANLFAVSKRGDTPTDALQLVPKSYVDAHRAYPGNVNSDGTNNLIPTGWTSGVVGIQYTITHNLGTTDYAVVATAVSTTAFARVSGITSNSFNLNFQNTVTNLDVNTAFNFILAT